MTIHRLQGPPPPELARALASFEEQFSYPLGPDHTFRISHGADYTRFFRAMGDAMVFVAEGGGGRVLGTVAAAVRLLRMPDGKEKHAVYLGDNKMLPAGQSGLTPVRLLRALLAEAANYRQVEGIFGVVMDGTQATWTPDAYSGRLARLGLPTFIEVGRIAILRIPTSQPPSAAEEHTVCSVSPAVVAEFYRRWTRGYYAVPAGDPVLRSELPPTALMLPDGSACGLLEDTRNAKILYTDDGELRSAHLSDFAYCDPARGAALLQAVLPLAAEHGNPALFVAVPVRQADTFLAHLGIPDTLLALATIYGSGLSAAARWSFNTAEI